MDTDLILLAGVLTKQGQLGGTFSRFWRCKEQNCFFCFSFQTIGKSLFCKANDHKRARKIQAINY